MYAAFEREDAQYQIATWYQKPYDQPGKRQRSIETIAEQFGVITLKATAESLKGSPLLVLGKAFYMSLVDAAGQAIKTHILKLNQADDLPMFTLVVAVTTTPAPDLTVALAALVETETLRPHLPAHHA